MYIDHTWLRVPAGASRSVQVFDEALHGFPAEGQLGHDITEELWGRDNQISIEGWADRPFPADCGAPTLTGGAGIRVGAGRATETVIEHAGFSNAFGFVRWVGEGGGEPDGRVVVVAQECDENGVVDPSGDRVTATGNVNNGRFGVEFRHLDAEFGVLRAYFLGDFGAAPSDSEPRRAED